MWTIEYQKPGIPHMHLLLFFDLKDRFLSANKIDEVVSAEFPNPELHTDGVLH